MNLEKNTTLHYRRTQLCIVEEYNFALYHNYKLYVAALYLTMPAVVLPRLTQILHDTPECSMPG